MSVRVSHLTKLYGSQKALDDVSLGINPGEVVGLLGPNGAGKSTLMKILTCFIPPSSGEASVCGFDVLEQSIEVRRRIGYLPENNPLYPDLYVKEFLAFIAGIDRRKNHQSSIPARLTKSGRLNNGNRGNHGNHGNRGNRGNPGNRMQSSIKTRISEIIEITGLQAEQHKKIGALSRGYRQRVGLAQALLHDPEVLILDEPTSGLDPNQLIEIRNLIQAIGREKTVILSTHIMQEVEAICSRTIIIHQGRIVADDAPKNLHNLRSSRVLVNVEFDRPVDGDMLGKIPGVLHVYSRQEEHRGKKTNGSKSTSGTGYPASGIWYFESDPATDIRPAVFSFAVTNGLTVLSMQREEQRLEEVFRELTRDEVHKTGDMNRET